MKLFLDTEFTGLRQGTTLISLAIIDEKDRGFYAEFTDFDFFQINDWIAKNVISQLILDNVQEYEFNNITYVKGTKEEIVTRLNLWLLHYEQQQCQVVADVLMYDWVLFAELFGGALMLPSFIHFIPIDLATLLFTKGINTDLVRLKMLKKKERDILKKIIGNNVQHNALYDVLVLKMCFNKLGFD